MKHIYILFFFVFLIITPTSIYAQCDPDIYANELDQFEQMLRSGTDPLEVFVMVESWASSANIICSSETDNTGVVTVETEENDTNEPLLSYSSSELGLQPVIGPIKLPNGILKAVIQTNDYMIVEVEELGGECIQSGFGSLFNISSGEATDTASNVIGSIDCEVLLSISNISEPWTLDFYNIPLDKSEPVQPIYSSDDYGYQAVIGFVTFEDGIYRARATTDGYLIVSLEPLEGDCDSGFGSLFNLSSGEATVGAEATLRTTSCTTLILTSNSSEPWTLEFEKLR